MSATTTTALQPPYTSLSGHASEAAVRLHQHNCTGCERCSHPSPRAQDSKSLEQHRGGKPRSDPVLDTGFPLGFPKQGIKRAPGCYSGLQLPKGGTTSKGLQSTSGVLVIFGLCRLGPPPFVIRWIRRSAGFRRDFRFRMPKALMEKPCICRRPAVFCRRHVSKHASNCGVCQRDWFLLGAASCSSLLKGKGRSGL